MTTTSTFMGAGSDAMVTFSIATASSGIGLGRVQTLPVTRTVHVAGVLSTSDGVEVGFDPDTFGADQYLEEIPRSVVAGITPNRLWNLRPLHPTLFVGDSAAEPCSACLVDGSLRVVIPGYGDNTSGHYGLVTPRHVPTWRVLLDGTPVVNGDGPFVVDVDPVGSTTVRLEESETMARVGGDTSTADTAWTVPLASTGAELPVARCSIFATTCTPLRVIAPFYDLPIDGSGTAVAGTMTGRVTLRHTEEAVAITSATLRVRYGSGAWQRATLRAEGGGVYAVSLPVPAGAGIATLELKAADAAGGSITQTITGAFTAST